MIVNKKNIETFSKNLSELDEIKGRSLWFDARQRFFNNRAAVVSLILLSIILIFFFICPLFAQWTNEEIDWVFSVIFQLKVFHPLRMVISLELMNLEEIYIQE